MADTLATIKSPVTQVNDGTGSKKGKASLRSSSKALSAEKLFAVESEASFSASEAMECHSLSDTADRGALESAFSAFHMRKGGDKVANRIAFHALLSNRSYRRHMPGVAVPAKRFTQGMENGCTGEGSSARFSLLSRSIKALYRTVKENAETGTKASPVLPVEWLTEPHRSLVFGALTACGISPAVKPSDAGLASLCNSKAVQVTLLIECVASKAKAIRADWDAFTVPAAPIIVSVPVSPAKGTGKRSKAKDKASKKGDAVKASSAE